MAFIGTIMAMCNLLILNIGYLKMPHAMLKASFTSTSLSYPSFPTCVQVGCLSPPLLCYLAWYTEIHQVLKGRENNPIVSTPFEPAAW